MSVQALNKCLVLEFKYEDDFFLVGFPSIFDLELLGEVIIKVFRGELITGRSSPTSVCGGASLAEGKFPDFGNCDSADGEAGGLATGSSLTGSGLTFLVLSSGVVIVFLERFRLLFIFRLVLPTTGVDVCTPGIEENGGDMNK